jgi:putative sigma-54 modulation protein
MHASDSVKEYLSGKIAKLPKYYDNIETIEAILDHEHGENTVEIIVHAKRKQLFVAKASHEDMYAGIDQCMDKISQQIRRYKDKVRDRQGKPQHQ